MTSPTINAALSVLGEYTSREKARAVVVAVLKSVREPSEGMADAADTALGDWRKTLTRDEAMARSYQAHDRRFIASATPAEKHAIRYRAMIDALILEVEGG